MAATHSSSSSTMRGYETIAEGSSPGESHAEDGGVRTFLRSSERRAQPDGSRRRKNAAVVSVGVLTLLGVLLSISTGRQQQQEKQQQEEDSASANFGSKHHIGASVSVFETSMHTGARLDQGFPSPAGLKEECTSSDSSSDSSDDDGETDGDVLCPVRGGWGTVVVNSDEKMQEIIGFGGAFTDAATINFYKLPEDVQKKVLDGYFGPTGIEYTIGRIPMGSCDFSVEQYSFDDVPGDYNMTYFDDGVEKDTVQRIPMIHEALKRESGLKLFTSPWSPPAWMKVPMNGKQSMIESAVPAGLLPDPNVHAAWALFFSRFISAYHAQGIDLWGLTIQNESENEGPWEACYYTAKAQADFIRDYLGPVIRRDHPDVKIIAYDHNRNHLVSWAKEMMRDEETSQYVDGMGFHWYYDGGNRLMDGSVEWGALNTTYHVIGEDKFLLSTESCNCPNVQHSLEGGWQRAEHTAHEIIADLNTWATGWVDWNLMLSYDGGPNHQGNLCDSPVVANKNHTDVIFQPMYYFLGHITKFSQPGARRLKSHFTGVYHNGGGGPAGAQPGFEATLYGCEGSVRQSWELTATGKISLADYYGAQYDWYAPLCLARAAGVTTGTVNLVPCDSDDAGTFAYDAETGHLVLQEDPTSPPSSAGDSPFITGPKGIAGNNDETKYPGEEFEPEAPPSAPMMCLDVLHGSTEDGATVTLAACDTEGSGEGQQQWEFAPVEGGAGEGSIVSASSGRCMTSGWPFFTGVALKMSEGSRDRYGKEYAVVVLNEAEEPVEFDLSFPAEGFVVRALIGPRSIQTILA